MVTFVPPINPIYRSSNDQVSPRTLIAQFGDGYEQRAADGLNSLERDVNLVFDNLTVAQTDTVIAFFEARGGNEAFDYTLPWESTLRQFRVESWRTTPKSFDTNTVTARFREVFDIT